MCCWCCSSIWSRVANLNIDLHWELIQLWQFRISLADPITLSISYICVVSNQNIFDNSPSRDERGDLLNSIEITLGDFLHCLLQCYACITASTHVSKQGMRKSIPIYLEVFSVVSWTTFTFQHFDDWQNLSFPQYCSLWWPWRVYLSQQWTLYSTGISVRWLHTLSRQ